MTSHRTSQWRYEKCSDSSCILKVDPPEFANGSSVERREIRHDSAFPV